MSFLPYVTDTQITDFSRKDLYNICSTLELEYRGGNMSLDTDNITTLVKGNASPKLSRFAVYTNIVGPIIDKENTTYINPPTRIFLTKNSGQISKKLQDHITDLYEQMQFDLFMAKAEKFTSLLGMTLFKPTFDEEDETMNLIELYPSNVSLCLTGNPKLPGKVAQIVYKYKVDGIERTVVADKDKAVTSWKDKDGKPQSDTDEHGFGILPFAILKFKIDNSRVYGPPDYELYSLCKHRSLILANTMTRMHLSDLEKLLIMGVDLKTAMANMKDRIIALPSSVDNQGNTVNPSAQYISPDGQDALNLLEAYFKLYQHIMDNRGHVQKIFSRGADVPSAESIRLGSVDLFNRQQEKKKFLSIYEQDVWKRTIKENNRFSDNIQIPEDTQLIVNFKPEPYAFANAADEVAYFQAAMTARTETPISWIKNRQSELTDEEALQQYQLNKKFYEDEKEEEAVKKQEEPTVGEEDTTINDIVEEDAGEGNPMPVPREGESHDDFISRGMSNETMVEEYPDENQRLAVLEQQWKKHNQ